MNLRKSTKQLEKGQSLIEFAFSLVMLLVLLSGIVDGGRALFTYMAMRDAAQEGALYASVNPTDGAGIEDRAREASSLLADLGGSLSVTVTPTEPGKFCAGMTNGVAHGMLVRIEYPSFPLTMPFIGMAIGHSDNSVAISAEVQDMIIIPKCP